MADTLILWRPVGQRELDLIADTGWTRFPPRLTGQPIFYPVLNEAYATKIARDWNTKDPASDYVGHVLRFAADAHYAQQFPPHRVGGAGIDELWIPAERLEEFNDHIVGTIELVASYRADPTMKEFLSTISLPSASLIRAIPTLASAAESNASKR